jgi:hypothetical protein
VKPEDGQIFHEVIQRTVENPKVGLGAAGFVSTAATEVAEPLIGITANDFALWLGIAVAAVSLYNQIMVAIRSHRKSKIKNTD